MCFYDMLRSTVPLWGISVVMTDIILRKKYFLKKLETRRELR
jgi:hypothetical protein